MAKKPDQGNDPWKSKGVGKLYSVAQRLCDVFIPPERQIAAAEAKAKALLINANSSAEAEASAIIARAQATTRARVIEAEGAAAVQAIEARAAMRIEADQIRQQRNIEAIMEVAYDALPESDADVSDEPVSDDFIHRFFDDSKNISDDQMQILWGRLLAGEIVRPGSYQPRVLSIIKDLTKYDADVFTSLCRFGFAVPRFCPLIFEPTDQIYNTNGINFGVLSHLDDLGLIQFSSLTGFKLQGRTTFVVSYGPHNLTVKKLENAGELEVGKVLLSAAGRQIARLTNATIVPEFLEYAIAKWRALGYSVTRAQDDAA